MASIKGKDTKPEMIVRRYLHGLGFRYGLHNRKLPGSPDLVFRQFKTVVFIHGCFWHGHKGCPNYRIPKSNIEFWKIKVEKNRERDIRVQEELQKKGWSVITIWECDLLKKDRRRQTLIELSNRLISLKCGIKPYEKFDEINIAAEDEDEYVQ